MEIREDYFNEEKGKDRRQVKRRRDQARSLDSEARRTGRPCRDFGREQAEEDSLEMKVRVRL